MFAERLRAGIHAGLIAASATSGALLAFGMGLDRPSLPFNLAAHVLVGGRASLVDGVHALITPLGVLVHVAAVLIWAMLFAAIAAGRHWLVRLPAGVLFAAVIFLLNTRFLPSALRPGYESVLSEAQMVFLHVALAATLVAGTRIAFPARG